MKRVMYCLLAVALLAALVVGCAPKEEAPAPAAPAKPAPIVLKMVGCFPLSHPNSFPLPIFVDRVNERAKGELEIKLLGGPEVIPSFNQWAAVTKGVVDLNFNVPSYYWKAELPESILIDLSVHRTAKDERESGFFDWEQRMYNRKGVQLLAGRQAFVDFFIWPNKRVKTPQELEGLKLRSGMVYDPFFKKLGITPVVTPYAETYTALERGTVDGFAWPLTGPREGGWCEITKFVIDHGFYGGPYTTLANTKSFQRLPKHLQDLLMDIGEELDIELPDYAAETYDKPERQALRDAGVELIKFSPEDAEWYLKTADQAMYETLKELCEPQYFEEGIKLAGYTP
ncbi:TRAP transporter substrate-binding protein DctP [Chloroflexota bacterium]